MDRGRKTVLVTAAVLGLSAAGPGLPRAGRMAGAPAGAGAADASASIAIPIFTDVTSEAGLDFVHFQAPQPPILLDPVYQAGGAAAGDADGDGWVDLYVTRLGLPGILFRNRGDGTFEDATTGAGLAGAPIAGNGVAWGDVDNDGDLDLYVATLVYTRFYLYINDGAGHFTEEGLARGAAVAGADAHFGTSVAFGDYDRDSWLDVHVTEWRPAALNPGGGPSNARLLRNRGGAAPGHFEDVTVAAGVALDGVAGGFSQASRFSDLDGDGHPDLLVTSDRGTSRLFWNNRDGTFRDGTAAAGLGTDENGAGSAIGDYDLDGYMDWFVTGVFDPAQTCATAPCGWGSTGNRLYRNNADRTFSDHTDTAGVRNGHWGAGAAFLDFDNDSDVDLVMTSGVDLPGTELDAPFNADPMRLWRNEGAGPMTEISALSGLTDTGAGRGLLTFDYDRDADVDIFVMNNSGRPALYRNDTAGENGWLRVQPRGRKNRHAIGAQVWVRSEPTSPWLFREIDAGSQFLGQSESTPLFGLGPASSVLPVNEVQVVWPHSFTVQTLRDVPRNTTMVIDEPVPPVTLKVNGQQTDSRVVATGSHVRVSLDMVPGPFTSSVDWYYALIAGGVSYWITPGGVSTTPAPLLVSPPVPLTDHTLFEVDWPAGTQVTVILLLITPTEAMAHDYVRINVTGPPGAP
jgi:hypothetical protein